jgi:DNA-binding transcriptional ArsR family regulator
MLPIVSIAGALADENRARIILGLALLREKGVAELCVCQMTEFLALAPSTVSKHLSVLKTAGLVDARKEGRWMYYRLATAGHEACVEGDGGEDNPAAAQAIAWVRAHALPRTTEEFRKWEAILNQDPEELCRRQACGTPRGKNDSPCCSSAPGTPAAPRWRKGSPKP